MKEIKNVIKYICALLNIDISDNEIILEDIYLELSHLKDVSGFGIFVKSQYNNEYLNYKTPFQKFLRLLENYKEIEAEKAFLKRNSDRVEKFNALAVGLIEKLTVQEFKLEKNTYYDPNKAAAFMKGDFFTDSEKWVILTFFQNLQNLILFLQDNNKYYAYDFMKDKFLTLLRATEHNKTQQIEVKKVEIEYNKTLLAVKNILEKKVI